MIKFTDKNCIKLEDEVIILRTTWWNLINIFYRNSMTQVELKPCCKYTAQRHITLLSSENSYLFYFASFQTRNPVYMVTTLLHEILKNLILLQQNIIVPIGRQRACHANLKSSSKLDWWNLHTMKFTTTAENLPCSRIPVHVKQQ